MRQSPREVKTGGLADPLWLFGQGTELQIRGSTEVNSKTIFLISQ